MTQLMDQSPGPASPWHHDHSFGQDAQRPGEVRTVAVIILTSIMMVVEMAAGLAFGSMALLADGLHMASHAVALAIAAFAYVYARKHAHDARYSFGTGKVNALGGFTGAILLAAFAAAMTWESLHRMLAPVAIAFDQAIAVAVIGLLINGSSLLILGHKREDEDASAMQPAFHGVEEPDTGAHRHHSTASTVDHGHHDHNLRAAYFHVLADALTSFLAIFALLAGKFLDQVWVDPVMGVVGGLLVGRWSYTLIQSTSAVLLDRQLPGRFLNDIQAAIESGSGHRVTDLHAWMIGPSIAAAEIVIVAQHPLSPQAYKRLIPRHLGLVHVTVEVHVSGDAE
jgi:cation diffusion facilitator family transporter